MIYNTFYYKLSLSLFPKGNGLLKKDLDFLFTLFIN